MDNNICSIEMVQFYLDRVENIVGKRQMMVRTIFFLFP